MTTRLPMADCHNDLLLGVHHQTERGHEDPFGDFWLPQLRAGGVIAQILPVFTEEQFVGEGALRRALLVLETAYGLAATHARDVAIVETADNLRAVVSSRRIALILALEGCEPIGADLGMLDTFFRLGVRVASLTWNRRTPAADGCGEEETRGRLTRFGVEMVVEMEHLGMVLDISHLSSAGVSHVAEIATKPYIASHSSSRALWDHPRNLTDTQMENVAASGGFVGINAFGGFLAERPTIDHYLDHIAHAVDTIGAGHVALGPDFVSDLFELMDPVLGGALLDSAEFPIVQDMSRPEDLSAFGPPLIERLGLDAATAVAAGTVIETLSRLLPGGTESTADT